ncbi:MAG TPA: SMC-Scp complex subunit ScpB [Candidatus Paceibacterota bacterium]|nr:SMC-Scp complex subunit ScpB [Candidatus Paceibacterota bacterium]HRZ34555.1 SMC-Scp complex subunit ScpB [Candidatus Paceibacterota bacterium]
MDDGTIEKQIESILFWKAEPVSFSELAKILGISAERIKSAALNLVETTRSRGMVVIMGNDELSLATSPETSALIEKLQKEELTKDLSRAALETLSVILYRGPMRRSEIDYVRGVNSQFILRILLIRGLIGKKVDEKDERAYIYFASSETLAHLGIQKIEDLPQFEKVNQDVNAFLERQQALDSQENKQDNVSENPAE